MCLCSISTYRPKTSEYAMLLHGFGADQAIYCAQSILCDANRVMLFLPRNSEAM